MSLKLVSSFSCDLFGIFVSKGFVWWVYLNDGRY